MKKSFGFTIVELAIIVTVIGILTAITVFTFGGAQERSQNAKTLTAARDYLGGLTLYYNKYGTYPPIPNGSSYMCLGVKYPEGPIGPDCAVSSQPITPMDTKLIDLFDGLPPEPSLNKYMIGTAGGAGTILSVEPKTLDGVTHNRWMLYVLSSSDANQNLCTVGKAVYGNWFGTTLRRTPTGSELPGTFAGTFRICAVPLPYDR